MFTEIAVVAAAALGSVLGVKISMNGLIRDVRELKQSLRIAADERNSITIRLTVVETDVRHITETLTRMEKN